MPEQQQTEQYSFADAAPRAAFHDLRGETSLSTDPFAPTASLTAPTDIHAEPAVSPTPAATANEALPAPAP